LVKGESRLRSKLLVLTGITLALMGMLAMLALEDLSHQFFRQEIKPWMNFSLVLVVLGITLIVAWYISTISSS
jgi:SNF family Na+-dependent transporter